jgi:hypothetical protein
MIAANSTSHKLIPKAISLRKWSFASGLPKFLNPALSQNPAFGLNSEH